MFFSKIKILGTGLFGILFLSYPFLIHYVPPVYLLISFVALTLLRAVFLLIGENTALKRSSLYTAMGVASLMSVLYFWKGDNATLYYPVVMSLAMALVFGMTLFYPPSMIEQFARLSTPDLDAAGVVYTRKVTAVWSLFCLLSAFLSFMTVILDNLELWTLYNGCLSYILMGLLFAGEYTYRKYRLYSNKGVDT